MRSAALAGNSSRWASAARRAAVHRAPRSVGAERCWAIHSASRPPSLRVRPIIADERPAALSAETALGRVAVLASAVRGDARKIGRGAAGGDDERADDQQNADDQEDNQRRR